MDKLDSQRLALKKGMGCTAAYAVIIINEAGFSIFPGQVHGYRSLSVRESILETVGNELIDHYTQLYHSLKRHMFDTAFYVYINMLVKSIHSEKKIG